MHPIGCAQKLQAHPPWQFSSPNAIPPAHTLTAFCMGVIAGARRFAHMEMAREDKEAVGCKLMDVPGYTFRMGVTHRTESPPEWWRDDNGRAAAEPRLEELKNHLGADDVCPQNFRATQAVWLAVLFAFNLLSLSQQRSAPGPDHRQPATLRTAVFPCGASLRRAARQTVLHLSASWGGLAKHRPPLDAVLSWKNLTWPKWIPPDDQPSTAACRI